jgi:5-methylcytosine-specific restriction protein A
MTLSAFARDALEYTRTIMREQRPDRIAERRALAFKAFYSGRAWRAARYQFLKRQPRPLRCKCCGATAADARLCVDHIVSVKRDWSRRLDQENFQLLCNDCNLAKASADATDWREPPAAG